MPRITDALARLMPRWSSPAGQLPIEQKASRVGALLAFENLGRPVWTPRDYQAFAREGFMQNAVVYRCVRMIAEAAASVPLLLYEGGVEHESHPLLDLLARPNPNHTGHDFLESWFGFLLVAGNAYAEVVSAGGQLRELHVLRPDRMKVIPGPEGWPEGYEYTAGGQTVRFEADAGLGVRSILHMRLFHPVNDHYGMSPIEAAATAIDIHNAASNWNKALLDNSARPSGALVYGNAESRMTAEQFERLKQELEQGFVGAKHAGRPLLLEGGLDWKPLSLSPKDMDFIEAKNSAAREIALALGVPPMLLGIPGDNTYSNYQEAQRAFWRQTVLPLVNRTARALSGWLAPAFASGTADTFSASGQIGRREPLNALNLIPDLDSVEALSSEREALWARLERTTFLTANEKRAAVGYEAIEDAPVPNVAVKYSPDQPRVSPGNSDGGQWTDGGGGSGTSGSAPEGNARRDEIIGGSGSDRVADEESPKYTVTLQEEDSKGGHTVRDHVGKSDAELLGIVETEVYHGPNVSLYKEAQGSFLSIESGNDLVNRVLERNIASVDAVASGSIDEVWLVERFGFSTGKEAFRPGPELKLYMRPTFEVGVLIRHDPRTKRGYRVHTAFPRNQRSKK